MHVIPLKPGRTIKIGFPKEREPADTQEKPDALERAERWQQGRLFRGKVQRLRSEPAPELPTEIFWEVAKQLRQTFHLETIARLGQTCRAIREVTLPVLYETVIWDGPYWKVWDMRSSGLADGLKYVKHLILDEKLLTDLQLHARRRGESDETLPLDSFDMFPQLVSIMLTEETEQYGWGPEKHQRMWETRFHMHLYGTITPIELVRAAVSRPPPEDKDDEHFQDFLSKWDAANDADNDNTTSSESSAESENTYDNEFTGLTLHKYARLITNERFPSASLSTPMEGGWKILPNRDEDYIFVPRLDIRHLTAKDAQLNQTLRGCTWLVQGPLYTRFRTDSIAEVDCRLEVILPLLETYTDQKPFEFYITLCHAVGTESFVTAIEKIADYLTSIPERTKLASGDPGEWPFLKIEYGQPDDHEEFFDYKLRASFTLHIEQEIRPPRCYFLLSVNARTNPQYDPEARTQVQFDRSYQLGSAPPR